MVGSEAPVMEEPTRANSSSSQSSSTSSKPPSVPAPPPPPSSISLIQPSSTRKRHNNRKVFRVFRSVFRTFPIMTPVCKLPSLPSGLLPDSRNSSVGSRVTGTLFGFRKGHVSLSIQENPKTLPTLVVELAMQTHALQREMSIGMVRIALECDKRSHDDKTKVLEEPLWSMFCNGKKIGHGMKRDATEEDLHVMEVLKAVSMGAGVLPGKTDVADGGDGEIAYMRAHFERVVGSKDSETLYMLSPDGNDGPELSIFFVRI